MLALTDANPHGLDIVANIQHGPRGPPFRADGKCTPSVQRAGVKFMDLTK